MRCKISNPAVSPRGHSHPCQRFTAIHNFTLFWRMGTPIHNSGRCDSHFRRLDSHFLAGKMGLVAKSVNTQRLTSLTPLSSLS